MARRVREDQVFKGLIHVKRGQPRRGGFPGIATVYSFARFFQGWAAMVERENQPPAEDLVVEVLQGFAAREGITSARLGVTDIAKVAFTDVENRLGRPLKLRDERKINARALELASARLAELEAGALSSAAS